MRTLKKSLALVLALVMVLGLGVVGASADNKLDDYNDLDKLDAQYEEAAGVLTGLGIVAGIDSVTLDPDGYYTREQAAKIITYMIMGADKAEALTCYKAPFDDVAADHWSAKYISYCAEAGIIDGVGGNKFDPYSKLTGYQWAKMLLSAVGFGYNGEFTGDSWSLGTATVAAQTDLFAGDLEGGDHVALRREQAMLYAFNTLAYIRQVTYTSNGNNYVYDIEGYEWADGTGLTLGQDVYGLASDEGIVTDTVGNGAQGTYLSDGYTKGYVWYHDDSGLDMMYHAARIWYTPGDVAIYVHDLATATNTTCLDIPAAKAANASAVGNNRFTLGVALGRDYEYSFINNTALGYGYADVTVKYVTGTLGTRSQTHDNVVITGNVVDNDDVRTDISAIATGAPIVLTNCNGKYYVYAITSTTGHVREVAANGTITLSDGTVMAKSVMSDLANNDIAVNVDYTFTLDSHGHYIDAERVTAAPAIWYFTGAVVATPGDYLHETSYAAQAVNVATGDIQNFAISDENLVITANQVNAPVGYYNVNAPVNGFYTPVSAKTQRLTYTALTAVNGHDQAGFDGEDILYNENVQFIFVSGSGSTLVVNKDSVGIADLLTDYDASAVVITSPYLTYALNSKGSYEASAVFAPSSAVSVTRNTTGYIYIDDSCLDGATEYSRKTESDDHTYTYWEYPCYINGEKETFTILTEGIDNAPDTGWTRGFYRYYVEADGNYVLTKLGSNEAIWNEAVTSVEGTSGLDKVNGYNVTGATVVDIREGADVVNGVDKIDSINDLSDFYQWSLADEFITPPQISMVTVDGIVSVIYVVGGAELINY